MENVKTLAPTLATYEKALPLLEKAKSSGYNKDHMDFYMGRAYHLDHQFDLAIQNYAPIIELVDIDESGCSDSDSFADSANIYFYKTKASGLIPQITVINGSSDNTIKSHIRISVKRLAEYFIPNYVSG